jgi:hypothetical protein
MDSLTFYKVFLTVSPSKGQHPNLSRYKITPIAQTSDEKEYPKPEIAYGAI